MQDAPKTSRATRLPGWPGTRVTTPVNTRPGEAAGNQEGHGLGIYPQGSADTATPAGRNLGPWLATYAQQPHTHTHSQLDSHIHTHTCTHENTQSRRHADTQTRRHRHTATHAHRHTHTHTDTCDMGRGFLNIWDQFLPVVGSFQDQPKREPLFMRMLAESPKRGGSFLFPSQPAPTKVYPPQTTRPARPAFSMAVKGNLLGNCRHLADWLDDNAVIYVKTACAANSEPGTSDPVVLETRTPNGETRTGGSGPRNILNCHWVGSLDFTFLVEIKNPQKVKLFAGGSTATKYQLRWFGLVRFLF